MLNISFIGLGVMGYPMAGWLKQQGHKVTVYNRTTSKAHAWVKEYGGEFKETPALASKNADIVFMCVGNDDDVRSVVYGKDGIFAGLQKNALIVDHTTTSFELALELSKACNKVGVNFVDAPVSGGQAGAENGTLAIMLGGDIDVVTSLLPVMAAYAKKITHMGKVGSGQMTKMVNQILIAGVLQGISEGFTLAKHAGLDLNTVIEAIAQGAAGSWQLSNRGESIEKGFFNYGFAIDWMVKDLGFCLDEASRLGLTLVNTEWVNKQYKILQSAGHNREDTSALIKQFG